MIGKPVSSEEFQEVLDRQAASDKFRNEVEAELKAIKPGECLLYEAKEGVGPLASLGLSLLVGKIGGLKMITEDQKVYIYRSK